MHKVTTSVHQPPLPTISGTRRRPIATSMDEQLEHRPRQQIISAEQLQLIETATETPSEHPRLLQITSETLQQPIVTAMVTPQEQTDQARITLVIPTLVTLIPTAIPEAYLPLQQTTLATQPRLIVTETVTPKDPPHPQPTTLEIAAPNSEATIPTPPSGPGNEHKSSYNKPRMHLSHLAFEAHSFLFTNQPPKQAELTQNG